MRIAYIITAYQDPYQLKRLINSLNFNADFYIHIDKKVNIDPFKESLTNKKNVFFTAKRFFINWGSFAQVLAQKELLKTLFEHKIHYERVVCLSGMDYPIFSNLKIAEEFTLNKSKQYIMGFNLSQTKIKKQIEKITLWHFFRDLKVKNRNIKRFFCGFSRYTFRILPFRKKKQVSISGSMKDIYMGSDYWALTYNCAKYVYETMCTEKHLMRYFKYSYVPSEMCIQTIIFNSKYSDDAILFTGDYPQLVNLTPLHFITYNKAIKVYNENDYNTLINCNKMFFRKAKTGYSEKLIEMIEKNRIEK